MLPTEMTVIEAAEPGSPDVLRVAKRPLPALEPHQILIKATAAGINGPDLVQRRGQYPPPKDASDLLGLEVSGEVVSEGNAQSRWTAGDQVCALTNGGGYAEGAVRRMRTSLYCDSSTVPYAEQRPRHSSRAAVRLSLNMSRLGRLRSWLKWLKTEEWTAANFCKLRMRLMRCIARSRRRNGKCEFSTRLLSHLPQA